MSSRPRNVRNIRRAHERQREPAHTNPRTSVAEEARLRNEEWQKRSKHLREDIETKPLFDWQRIADQQNALLGAADLAQADAQVNDHFLRNPEEPRYVYNTGMAAPFFPSQSGQGQGQGGQQGSTGSNPFGNPPATSSSSAPLFGGTATSGGSGPGLFGGTSSTPAASTGPSNPFGSGTAGSTSLFGGNPSTGTPSNLFGGGNTGNTGFSFTQPGNTPGSTAPSASGPNLFGGNTPGTTGGFGGAQTPSTGAGAGSAPWSFKPLNNNNANTNTTGPSGGGGGLFGSTNTPTSSAPGSNPLFGGGAYTGTASHFGNPSTTPNTQNRNTGSILGNSTTPATSVGGSGLFQNLGTTTPRSNPTSGINFSTTPAGNPPSGAANMFGGGGGTTSQSTAQPQQPPTTSGGGMFQFPSGTGSTTPAAQPPQGTSTGGGASSLFGEVSRGQGSSSLFPSASSGGQQGGSIPTPSGGQNTQQPPASSGGGSLFPGGQTGAPGATGSSSSNIFGGAQTGASGGSGGSTSNLFSRGGQPPPPSSNSGTTGGLFSGVGSSNTSQGGTTNAAPTGGSLFGGGGAAGGTSQPSGTAGGGTGGAATTSGSGGSGLFGATTSGAASGASTTGATGGTSTTAGPAPPTQSRLASKSMDEILTTWSTSLSSHQKTFSSLAKQVSVWDRQLVENAGKISGLYGRCFQAERDVAEVERQLSTVEHGQVELEQVLERYEGMVDEMLEADGGQMQGDGERERTYKTAELCSTRLTDMGHSLTSMIEEINVASSKLSSNNKSSAARQDDPLAQIVRVLNGHLQQLQAIDSGASDLAKKVEQAQKDTRVLEQRQGIRDGGWVEGFGRAYLGRS